jgi:signal peptidase II
MEMASRSKNLIVLFFFSAALILDQGTKFLVVKYIKINQEIPLIGEVVRLKHIKNSGIVFGFDFLPGILVTILSIVASLGIVLYLIYHRNEVLQVRISLAVILGGALGNLLDRIFYQRVTDFIDIGFGATRWPIFNFADAAVVVGMILLFYQILKNPGSQQVDKKAEDIPTS